MEHVKSCMWRCIFLQLLWELCCVACEWWLVVEWDSHSQDRCTIVITNVSSPWLSTDVVKVHYMPSRSLITFSSWHCIQWATKVHSLHLMWWAWPDSLIVSYPNAIDLQFLTIYNMHFGHKNYNLFCRPIVTIHVIHKSSPSFNIVQFGLQSYDSQPCCWGCLL